MGVFGGDWHSDFSFLEAPPSLSILYAAEIPPLGGDTVWCNMAAAYAALDHELKSELQGRAVIHTGAPYGVQNAPPEDVQSRGSIRIERNNPEADRETLHPAVCRHPLTGEAALFVNPTYSTRFDGMSEEESRPLLQRLYTHCTRPEFTCRYRWKRGTVALWDNRMTLHYAVNDYDGYRRLMYRTAVGGGRPVPDVH
jgi:taurine dioxygenase